MSIRPFSDAVRPHARRDGRRRVIVGLLLLAAAVATPIAQGQGIVRWVDDKGQVHYSDHAPPGNTPVSTVTRTLPPSDPAAAAAPSVGVPPAGNTSSDSAAASEDAAAAARRRQADQEQAAAAQRKFADDAAVARCRQQHETDCYKGADAIRQREKTKLLMDCAQNVNQYGAPSPSCRGLSKQ